MTEGADDLTAAEARVDAWFAAFDRLDVEAFGMTALPAADDPVRMAALEWVERLAEERGLGGLLGAAREAARTAVLRRYDEGGYRPTMVGLNWGVSEGTARDRVAAAAAAEDAVSAAVVEPWADEATLATLASPFELIDRGRGVRTEFDLSRATADRLEGRTRGSSLAWAVVLLAVVGGVGGLVTGSLLPILVGLVLAAGAAARRARDA